MGDSVPVEGDSFHYPDYFDIISPEDSAAILIRSRKVQDIISLDSYQFGGLPVLDERGFALKIGTEEELKEFLESYQAVEKETRIAFYNKWSKFETYRRIVCNENFWVI